MDESGTTLMTSIVRLTSSPDGSHGHVTGGPPPPTTSTPPSSSSSSAPSGCPEDCSGCDGALIVEYTSPPGWDGAYDKNIVLGNIGGCIWYADWVLGASLPNMQIECDSGSGNWIVTITRDGDGNPTDSFTIAAAGGCPPLGFWTGANGGTFKIVP